MHVHPQTRLVHQSPRRESTGRDSMAIRRSQALYDGVLVIVCMCASMTISRILIGVIAFPFPERQIRCPLLARKR